MELNEEDLMIPSPWLDEPCGEKEECDESDMYCCNPDCMFYGQKVKTEDDGSLTFYCAYCGSIELSVEKPSLSPEDKAVADRAAKLIARDYGEVIKKLEEE